MAAGERALPWIERARRAQRIGATGARVYLAIRAERWLRRALPEPEAEAARRREALHRRNAELVYAAAVDLRGLILKGCQFLGSRADVLPPAWTEVLSRLQDRVPPHSFSVVRRRVEHELGAPLEEVFAAFAERPLASASLAQVHEARLRDGRRVAVKVQYPEIASLVRSDLANLRALFRAVGFLERDFDLMPVVEELGRQVPRELDFVNEGKNAEAIGGALAPRGDVRVPEIVWEHTTRRVLTMEFMEGIKITDRARLEAAGIDRGRLTRTLIEAFAEQILVHGFFHGDPHPGNLLVEPESGRLVLLDFGLAKELPGRFRETVLRFVAALVQGEARAMGEALVELGFETRDGRPEALHELAELLLRAGQAFRARGGVDPETIARLRDEIPARVRANPVVRIPQHLVLLGRVIGLLSGVNSALGARQDLARVLAPYVLGASPFPRPDA